jgi:hypothetical protein
VPVTTFHRTVNPRRLILVEVSENAILVLETSVGSESNWERSQGRRPREGTPVKRFAEHSHMLHH